MKHITSIDQNIIDKINHLDLRSDLENDNIYDTFLQADGKTHSSPENFTISCLTNDEEWVTDYHYDSKTEYEQDVKLLKLAPKKLTITKQRFLDWYFDYGQDQENAQLRVDLATSIIDQMYKVGFGSYSVQELFDNCNQESIRAYFTVEYDMQTETHDDELSDLKLSYELTLID
jgi:hypothetical protein